MIDSDDRWYYIARARTCRELAQKATDPTVVELHNEFRRLYLLRADHTPLRLRRVG